MALKRLSAEAAALVARPYDRIGRLYAAALLADLHALAATLRDHRDSLGQRLGQTLLRRQAVTAYARLARAATNRSYRGKQP